MELKVIQAGKDLIDYLPAIEDLAAAAIEPNVFYEHWMLLPALTLLGNGANVQIILIFEAATNPASASRLCGLIPLELNATFYKLPVRNYTNWQHKYCFLGTPLLRKEQARETLTVFFAWLRTHDERPALLQFKHISGEGPFYEALMEVVEAEGIATYQWETFDRALFKPSQSGEHYLEQALSGRRRKEFRRQQRLLGEQGAVSFSLLEASAVLATSIEKFLALEASGWKGRAHTAFASDQADRDFFAAITREAAARDRLMLLSLNVDDQPIAMKYNLLAGEGSFAFKIAYDERFNQYSPGVLLEIENIRALHRRPEIDWMDSCAAPVHFMINRLWVDRRTIKTIIISTEKWTGAMTFALLPWMKWAKNKRQSKISSEIPIAELG